jgi:hypothetical protein
LEKKDSPDKRIVAKDWSSKNLTKNLLAFSPRRATSTKYQQLNLPALIVQFLLDSNLNNFQTNWEVWCCKTKKLPETCRLLQKRDPTLWIRIMWKMNSWSRGTVTESAHNFSDPCIVRKVTSQAVQIEGNLKATNTTAPDPFTSQRKNVSGGNLWCKKYHKTWSLSLLLQYKPL